MTQKTFKGKISLTCDVDKKKRVYNCSMFKLKQKKKAKASITGERVLPELDAHEWNTESIRVHSEVELPDPFGGVASRAGGSFVSLIPSDTYLECKTGLKAGKLSLTKCIYKEK